jgi:hypothetical protein
MCYYENNYEFWKCLQFLRDFILTVLRNSCVWSIKTFACVFNFNAYEFMYYHTLICNAVDVLFLPNLSISLAHVCILWICMAAVEECGNSSYIYWTYREWLHRKNKWQCPSDVNANIFLVSIYLYIKHTELFLRWYHYNFSVTWHDMTFVKYFVNSGANMFCWNLKCKC